MKDWIIKNIVDDNEVASSHWKTEFVITLDMLWHARNLWVFERKFQPPQEILNNIKSFFRGDE
jgi:hypothetical protein